MRIRKFNENDDFVQEPISGEQGISLQTVRTLQDNLMPSEVKDFFHEWFDDVNDDGVWLGYIIGSSSEDEISDKGYQDDIEYGWSKEVVIEHGSILDKWILENCDVKLNDYIHIYHCY